MITDYDNNPNYQTPYPGREPIRREWDWDITNGVVEERRVSAFIPHCRPPIHDGNTVQRAPERRRGNNPLGQYMRMRYPGVNFGGQFGMGNGGRNGLFY